jgi:hypothetical protein
MQRLIEQPSDEGDMREGDAHIGRVHYHLAVYHHFPDEGVESVPEKVEVEGRIRPVDDLNVADLHRLGLELTLRLADGRSLDFVIVHEDGTIHSTGRGLFVAKPESRTRR